MQVYEKSDIDARTFPQIWETLTSAEQAELRDALIKKTSCTRQSIFNWSNGTSPIYRDIRVKVADTIKKTFGFNVSHLTLFPSAR